MRCDRIALRLSELIVGIVKSLRGASVVVRQIANDPKEATVHCAAGYHRDSAAIVFLRDSPSELTRW